jgi:hypothetical protein
MKYPHIYDFIMTTLGHPTVNVELTGKQIEMCAEEAIKKWVQYTGYDRKFEILETVAGVNGYNLPRDIKNPKEDVFNVFYNPDAMDYDDMTLYLLINQYYYYFRSSQKQLMTDYTMFKGYIEDLHRTLGTYGSWEILNKKLYLFPAPRHNVKYMVIYRAWPPECEIDENQWVMRYTRALAKAVLGQVRGKFTSGILGPGGAINFNASDLLSQSKDETTTLITELRMRTKPVGIITG